MSFKLTILFFNKKICSTYQPPNLNLVMNTCVVCLHVLSLSLTVTRDTIKYAQKRH